MKCCPKFPLAFIIVFAFGAFFYYQYSFTSSAKVNFSDSFYQYKNNSLDIFTPQDVAYNLCFYSGISADSKVFLEKKLKDDLVVLGIDFYGGALESRGVESFLNNFSNFVNLRVGSTLMLKLIHSFNLESLPKCYKITQSKDNAKEYIYLKEFGFYKVVNIKENNKE